MGRSMLSYGTPQRMFEMPVRAGGVALRSTELTLSLSCHDVSTVTSCRFASDIVVLRSTSGVRRLCWQET